MIGTYEICVKGLETYTIFNAKSEKDAMVQAIDYFCDDDEWYGSEETEKVTEDDCEIKWFEAN